MEGGESGNGVGVVLRGRTIGFRIAMLVGLAVFLAVALVTSVLAYHFVTSDFANRKRALESTGYVFASALADHVAKRDAEASQRVLRSIRRIPDVTFAAVIDDRGAVFASFGTAVITDTATLESDAGMFAAIRSGAYPVAIDIVKAGKRIGQVLLIADVSDVLGQLYRGLLTSLAVAAIAIGVSFAIAGRLISRITGPIQLLTTAIQEIRASRRYTGRVAATADGEPGLLIDSFNAMIDDIQARDDALERHRQTLEATVEQRTHELRLARDAADQANQAKSSFLATMSHEIRTPLSGLMVMAELLAGAGLDARHQRYAEVIVKSGRSLLTIINDILDLSKIEAGKLRLEIVPVNPAQVADDVVSLFWDQARSRGLDLAARVAPSVPLAVMADPVRLNQIVSNLVNNALKFTERGQVLVSLHYDAGHLTLAVTDSGIGIPPKKLNQLFEAFSQADQSISRRFGGTGLGLAICRRLAEAMGGTIGVGSEPGKGSTFWVRLPLALAAPPPRYGFPALAAALAVDGLASQSALGTALAAAGFTVTLAADHAGSVDVVFASARRLRSLSLSPGARPKVICIGAMGEPDGEEAVAAGIADDLMVLPLRQCDITDTIVRIHRNDLRGRAALERRAPNRPPRASHRGRRVLVADDNAVNREVIIEVLRQLDVTVDVAVNGREAVDSWKANRPDLVFMDCAMPEMDGYAATREIRAYEALALAGGHTPIVALTAHVAGADSEQWRASGMDVFLTKPFTLDQIAGCLDSQLAGRPLKSATPAIADSREDVLDPQVIAELRNIGGSPALFRRVLELFAGRVPAAVEQVSGFVGSPDVTALADAVHALKSMCANIGAHRAVAACHDLERAARSGGVFDAGAMLARIISEIRMVMGEVERLRAAG
jgi:signal transduction histidine kinase/CheY-like chemotaxis protein